MAKISMAKAAQVFAVSRPTLLKHLKQGKITGEKTTVDKNTFWQIDEAELARVYPRRDEVSSNLPGKLTNDGTGAAYELQAEIRVLQARLEAAQAMIEEKDNRIDDLRRMLPGPDDRPQDREERRSILGFFRRNHQ